VAAPAGSVSLQTVAPYAGWPLVLSLCVLVYWPGLSGPFLFDDYGSLADLGNLGGVRDWFTFKAFVFGGYTGPTGRPLSLLSFLIDANNWPADPWPFKRTNLVIHLLNGVLLGAITQAVLRVVGIAQKRARVLALVSAACWLLHPFLVSTTLYAVQRMAQLSTLFIFLGMLGYLRGRALLETRPRKAYVGMSIALGLGTVLSMLCKENGILLPLLVLILESTIIAAAPSPRATLQRYWKLLFLVLPSVVVGVYLVVHVFTNSFFEPIAVRNFSIFERLLTEGRILVDYLRHWYVPDLYTAGVFQDHFSKSTGLFAPVSTVLSLVFHVLLIGLCVRKRREWPLFAFGVLFYYGSHVLESTVLNLELYFEHRNYLAAAFLLPPLIVTLGDRLSRPLFAGVALLMIAVLAGFTRYSAGIWASYPAIVEASAQKAPLSARAQQQYALLLYNALRYDEALQHIDAAIERLPNDEQLLLLRSTILCNLGLLSAADFARMQHMVSSHAFDQRAMNLYETFVNSVNAQSCPDISPRDVRNLFASMLSVPVNADEQSLNYAEIQYFLGRVDVQLRDPERAMQDFRASLSARSSASRAMHMAAIMASSDYFDEALQLSDTALGWLRAGEANVLAGGQVSERDVLDFQSNIRLEMQEGHPDGDGLVE
jgi:protein O-mannosyl-transferase